MTDSIASLLSSLGVPLGERPNLYVPASVVGLSDDDRRDIVAVYRAYGQLESAVRVLAGRVAAEPERIAEAVRNARHHKECARCGWIDSHVGTEHSPLRPASLAGRGECETCKGVGYMTWDDRKIQCGRCNGTGVAP